jgi:protein-disulfide isomerase
MQYDKEIPNMQFPSGIKNIFGVALLGTISLAGQSGAPAQAQNPSTQDSQAKDPNAAILDALKAIRGELHDIKTLLATRPTAAAAPSAPAAVQQSVQLDLSNRPFRGDKSAPVTLVEITDYQCPFCGRHARETLPQIEKEYVDTGKVKYYVIDLPLESLHRDAFKAAMAVRCANEQGKYWEMHDQLFANQQKLSDLDARAAAAGLDTAKFDACLASDKYGADVRKDIGLTQAAGVSGTPGFYFANTQPGTTKVKTVKFVGGAQQFPAFKAEIDALLNHEGQGKESARDGL